MAAPNSALLRMNAKHSQAQPTGRIGDQAVRLPG
jgi:hypothetical protein